MNPYIYNPAYAGVEGHTAIFPLYRRQWVNVNGAPQLSHLSFHTPLKGGVAIGASFFNIIQGLLTTSAGKFSTSYLINIDRTHFIRFGLSIGAGINSVNITEFDSPGDHAFDNFLNQSAFFLGDFGFTYHFGHFNIGASLPNLFGYNPITQSKIADIKFSPIDNILFKMNYRGHISDNLALEPHLIYRYSSVIPHQYEAVLIAHIHHLIWIGASYRQDAGIIGLAGAKIKEKFAIGFAYELGNNNINSILGPTLEVNLGYHLGIKKEHVQHSSSFIKSHRLSAEERAKKAELKRQEKLASLQESRNLNIEEEKSEPPTITPPIFIPKDETPEEQPEEEQPEEEQFEEEQVQITKDAELYEEDNQETTRIRTGEHMLELPNGNYIIAGSFLLFKHAENYSDDLFQKGYHDTIIGYSSVRGSYYVVIYRSDNINFIKRKHNEFKQIPELSKVWILQVTK